MRDIHHIQGNDNILAGLQHLLGQHQIALQIRRVDDIYHEIVTLLAEKIPCDYFI